MKTKKTRYLLILTLCFVIFVGAYYLIVNYSALPNNSQSLIGDKSITNLDSQAQCATQAEVALNKFSELMNFYSNFTQTNHYNKKINKCFALIKFSYWDTQNHMLVGSYVNLLDAYENTNLAGCSNELCSINSKSVSRRDYEDFVREKMETTL